MMMIYGVDFDSDRKLDCNAKNIVTAKMGKGRLKIAGLEM